MYCCEKCVFGMIRNLACWYEFGSYSFSSTSPLILYIAMETFLVYDDTCNAGSKSHKS